MSKKKPAIVIDIFPSISEVQSAISNKDYTTIKLFIEKYKHDTSILNSTKLGLTLFQYAMLNQCEEAAFMFVAVENVDVNITTSRSLDLDSLLGFAELMKSTELASKIENSARNYFKTLLKNHECILSNDDVELLSAITIEQLIMLKKLTEKLIKYNQLNSTTFTELLSEVKEMASVRKREFVEAYKIKSDVFSRIDLKSGITFFTKRGKEKEVQQSGKYGFVKRGYEKPDDSMPRWAIKTLKITPDNLYLQSEIIADLCKEAEYNSLLRRQTYLYFVKNKYKFVSEWKNGNTLKELHDTGKINNYTFKERLTWYISLLKELATLHHARVAHHDIHCGNVIIDTIAHQAAFVDFGESYIVDVCNRGFSVDMHALNTIILQTLFHNELSENSDLYSFCNHYLSNAGLYSSIIKYLFYAVDNNSVSRGSCSAEQELSFCQNILEKFDNLSADEILKIADETINRKRYSGSDAFYETKRSLKMSAR